MKRILSLILCLALFVLLVPAAAMAWDGIVAVTLEPGDTVYDICQRYGTNYYDAKDSIMQLNGIDEEWKLGAMYPGNTILIPINYSAPAVYVDPVYGNPVYTEPVYVSPAYVDPVYVNQTYYANPVYVQPVYEPAEDTVLCYVVPYVIRYGDSIQNIYSRWGLRYENYAAMIRSLNGVDNLDSLVVGATYYLPTTWGNFDPNGFYVTVINHVMRYGESAYDVFFDFGINYNRYYTILECFNGWRDLTRLSAGDRLLIPVV